MWSWQNGQFVGLSLCQKKECLSMQFPHISDGCRNSMQLSRWAVKHRLLSPLCSRQPLHLFTCQSASDWWFDWLDSSWCVVRWLLAGYGSVFQSVAVHQCRWWRIKSVKYTGCVWSRDLCGFLSVCVFYESPKLLFEQRLYRMFYIYTVIDIETHHFSRKLYLLMSVYSILQVWIYNFRKLLKNNVKVQIYKIFRLILILNWGF